MTDTGPYGKRRCARCFRKFRPFFGDERYCDACLNRPFGMPD